MQVFHYLANELKYVPLFENGDVSIIIIYYYYEAYLYRLKTSSDKLKSAINEGPD